MGKLDSTQKKNGNFDIYEGDNHFSIVCGSPGGSDFLLDSEANARRLCAAWNAVEGISTEALESGVVKDLPKIINALLNTAIGPRQRRELWEERAYAILAKLKGE